MQTLRIVPVEQGLTKRDSGSTKETVECKRAASVASHCCPVQKTFSAKAIKYVFLKAF